MSTAVATTPEQGQTREISVFEAIQIYAKQKAEAKQPFKIVIGTPCYGGLVHI